MSDQLVLKFPANKVYLKEVFDADLTIADMNKEVIIKLKDSPKIDQVSINDFLINSLTTDNVFSIPNLDSLSNAQIINILNNPRLASSFNSCRYLVDL